MVAISAEQYPPARPVSARHIGGAVTHRCSRFATNKTIESLAMRKVDVHDIIDNARFNRFHWLVVCLAHCC